MATYSFTVRYYGQALDSHRIPIRVLDHLKGPQQLTLDFEEKPKRPDDAAKS
ncbi:hypothetical protein [Schleiferilactobacillus shenzhenensis]|uniref:hypothetical protein n=1 Tax=Schleiferilactobacillus shenzhenensis TaxID=1231337 RepID=UPI000419DBDF|nr:hypothetical protein [Schleiferilactobacillus shenzhenensis]